MPCDTSLVRFLDGESNTTKLTKLRTLVAMQAWSRREHGAKPDSCVNGDVKQVDGSDGEQTRFRIVFEDESADPPLSYNDILYSAAQAGVVHFHLKDLEKYQLCPLPLGGEELKVIVADFSVLAPVLVADEEKNGERVDNADEDGDAKMTECETSGAPKTAVARTAMMVEDNDDDAVDGEHLKSQAVVLHTDQMNDFKRVGYEPAHSGDEIMDMHSDFWEPLAALAPASYNIYSTLILIMERFKHWYLYECQNKNITYRVYHRMVQVWIYWVLLENVSAMAEEEEDLGLPSLTPRQKCARKRVMSDKMTYIVAEERKLLPHLKDHFGLALRFITQERVHSDHWSWEMRPSEVDKMRSDDCLVRFRARFDKLMTKADADTALSCLSKRIFFSTPACDAFEFSKQKDMLIVRGRPMTRAQFEAPLEALSHGKFAFIGTASGGEFLEAHRRVRDALDSTLRTSNHRGVPLDAYFPFLTSHEVHGRRFNERDFQSWHCREGDPWLKNRIDTFFQDAGKHVYEKLTTACSDGTLHTWVTDSDQFASVDEFKKFCFTVIQSVVQARIEENAEGGPYWISNPLAGFFECHPSALLAFVDADDRAEFEALTKDIRLFHDEKKGRHTFKYEEHFRPKFSILQQAMDHGTNNDADFRDKV